MFSIYDGYETSEGMPTIFESCEGYEDNDGLYSNVDNVTTIVARAAHLAYVHVLEDVNDECNEELAVLRDWLDAMDWCDENGVDPSDGAAFMSVLKMG